MAIYKPGPAVAEIRGKIGGVVFARNKGGLYMRNFAAPTQGQFPARETAKANFGTNANAWNSLTDVQRAGWDNYGNQVGSTNSLGEIHPLTGLAAFIRSNSLLLLAGESAVEDAPSVPLGGPVLSSILLAQAGDEMNIQGGVSEAFTGEDAIIVVVQVSPPVTPGRNSPSGLPMRFHASSGEMTVTNGTFAKSVDAPLLGLSDRVWARARALTPDGRVGPPRYVLVTMS